MTAPKMICLVGWPKAGKNEVARILEEYFGAVTVDDGQILRLAAPHLFSGVDLVDGYSQAGKDKFVEVCGKQHQVRKLLGDLGQLLEDHFGEFFVPEQTLKRIAGLPPAPMYVFPSVRKRQGHFYRERGGLVFEVVRDVAPSPYDFDWFDKTACHGLIDNTGTVSDLEVEVAKMMSKFYGEHDMLWGLEAARMGAHGHAARGRA